MIAHYLRTLAGSARTRRANIQLGISLAFIAGAINAGGFLAVHQYTSHMTGIVSAIGNNLVLNDFHAVTIGLASIMSFTAGSAYSAILINWGRHHGMHSEYAYPLFWEAIALLGFGLMGGVLEVHPAWTVPTTILLLCFIMGLQNAIITKISNAEIRTTHMTGIITDIGIELGKAVYINSRDESTTYKPVRADRRRLLLLFSLLGAFSFGGTVGAVGFNYFGYTTTIPLAGFLTALAIVPMADDARRKVPVLLRTVHERRRTGFRIRPPSEP